MAKLSDIISQGLLAARPTAGVEGRLYFATDDSTLYRDNGAGWDAIAYGDASELPFTVGEVSDWDSGDPGHTGAALDELAFRIQTLEDSPGGTQTTEDAYASRPAAGNDGNLFFPNDGAVIERDDGAAWQPWGPIRPLVRPVLADFTWVNQGSATITDAGGALHMYIPGSSGSGYKILKKAIPSSPPWVVTACFTFTQYAVNYNTSPDLGWRESSSGKLAMFRIFQGGSTLRVDKYNSPTSYNSQYLSIPVDQGGSGMIWMRIADDGTYRSAKWSADGLNWQLHHQVARTDFLTADEVWWGGAADNASGYGGTVTLHSWEEG